MTIAIAAISALVRDTKKSTIMNLSDTECQSCVRKAQEICSAGYMDKYRDISERTFKCKGGYVVFFLPDHTPLHVDYVLATIRPTKKLLRLSDSERPMQEVKPGICILKSEGGLFQATQNIIDDRSYVNDIISRVNQSEVELRKAIMDAKRSIHQQDYGRQKLLKLFDKMSGFAGYCLDYATPLQGLEWYVGTALQDSKESASECVSDLLLSQNGWTYFDRIVHGPLQLRARDEPVDGYAVQRFTKGLGILCRYDITPCNMEEPERAKSFMESILSSYPNPEDAVEEIQRRNWKRRVNRGRMIQTKNRIINLLPKRIWKEEFSDLVDFTFFATDFNEKVRMYRSDAYEVFRKYAVYYYSDPFTPRISDFYD